MASSNLPASASSSLEVILNCIHDHAILSLDLEGHVQTWNVGAEKLFGFTEAEIIGQHFSCFCTPEDVTAPPDATLAEARNTGTYEGQG
jgi:PAS domain S-box-containing protein